MPVITAAHDLVHLNYAGYGTGRRLDGACLAPAPREEGAALPTEEHSYGQQGSQPLVKAYYFTPVFTAPVDQATVFVLT